MSGILRLESLTKGNTLKQGDKTPLKYRLFDADGEKLNIAGKSAKVRLVYPDFLTIGYEKDGLTVAQDDTVTFTIDSVIPSRVYHVEIIVDDKFIFPSRADESKFTVDKSSLGTEANIIEVVGVDAVVRKAVDLINDDPSLIIDEDKLVGDIISNTGIGSIEEYYQQYSDVIKELSEDKDYHSLPEIAGARRGYDTLAESLQNLSPSMLNPNLGKLTQNHMSDELLAQIAGDTAVNAVPADGSLTTEKFADKAVTLSKLNINGYLPRSLSYDVGTFTGDNSSLRAHTLVSSLPSGTSITSLNAEFEFTLYVEISLGVWVSLIAWGTEYLVPEDMTNVTITVRRFDNTSVRSYVNELGDIIEIADDETAVKRKDIKDIIDNSKIPSELSILISRKPLLEKGGINADGSNMYGNLHRRARTPDYLDLKSGTTIRVSDPNYAFIMNKEGESDYYPTSLWYKDFTLDEDARIKFMVDNRNGESATLEEITNIIEVVTPDHLARISDIPDGGSAENVKYVGLDGSDSNDGNSSAKAFKTLQRALDTRAETIYIQRGNYFNQSANTTQALDKLTILPAGNGKEKVNFIGGDKLEGWTEDGTIFKRTLTSGINFNEVFISKTIPPMSTVSRPSPNAVLWESSDFEIDYMMTPVLTLDECRLTQGTFHWDGSYIYINPESIDNDFWLPKIQNGIDLSDVNHLIGQDITANYYINRPLRLENIKKLDVSGFEAHHSAMTDGFSLDYTYGDLTNCKANKNRNDGYNNHIEGHVNMYNCEGINNFDDGASPHEDCSMTVYGGIYRGNFKGGVIPANGATARVYNAILENNGKGFHNADTAIGKSISSGNLYIGNTIAIQNDNSNDFTSINDKFIENTNDFVGTFDRY